MFFVCRREWWHKAVQRFTELLSGACFTSRERDSPILVTTDPSPTPLGTADVRVRQGASTGLGRRYGKEVQRGHALPAPVAACGGDSHAILPGT